MVQMIVVFITLLFFVRIVTHSSKNRLQDRQAFLWLALSIAGLAIAFFLPLLDKYTKGLGINHFPTLVFSVGFLIVFIILVYQTTIVSKQQSEIKKIAQEISFLKNKIKSN